MIGHYKIHNNVFLSLLNNYEKSRMRLFGVIFKSDLNQILCNGPSTMVVQQPSGVRGVPHRQEV